MLKKNYSGALYGINAVLVEIEVDCRNGLAGIAIVGLPDTAIKESKERVLTAIKNCGYLVAMDKFITVNLAPADLKKVGTLYDLPLAISILESTGQLRKMNQSKILMAGELGLDGNLKPINGALLFSILAQENNFDYIAIPEQNAEEASILPGTNIIPIKNLRNMVEVLKNPLNPKPFIKTKKDFSDIQSGLDFEDVKGQKFIKRAIEIAAAGGHHILMIGSPGCGKSMLAKRIPSILPDLSQKELIDVIKVYSVAGKLKKSNSIRSTRPFRSPHHTISYAGLIGGTAYSKPGEISLAHQGVLFLDEFLEFRRDVLEALRQPLEDGEVHVTRANNSFSYPAQFMVVASANPCPCGYLNHPQLACQCSPNVKKNYLRKISGPILDRFDMVVEVQPLTAEEILSKDTGEKSERIKSRIKDARDVQRKRYSKDFVNSRMDTKDIRQFCKMKPDTKRFFSNTIKKFSLSARVSDKILRLARTIADLDFQTEIDLPHLLEALQYRKNFDG